MTPISNFRTYATLSDDGLYRYNLSRYWSYDKTLNIRQPIYGFIGVNPSTADAETDDATTRKLTGFVRRWGGRGYEIANLYAFRATDVKELAKVSDPFGRHNYDHMKAMLKRVDIIVPCWGNLNKIDRNMSPTIWTSVYYDAFVATDKPIKCFGLTKHRHDPKHPLMLPYSTELVDF